MTYKHNTKHGIWMRPGGSGISYADGTESHLFDRVSESRDVGVFSDDLASCISDWPTEYHFSRSRHCLLRPLGIKPGDRVLELGCGCGALTRYLGECGARVTAVEGSLARAKTAAARCRDLPEVRVILDDLTCFSSDSLYDWVLLIGVLEYAPVYSTASDPVHEYLRQSARFLDSEGRLVIAIENKLGLKYFNGCSEDHIGRLYYGIQGLYDTKEPITFGKKELCGHLAEAGFAAPQFFYPFPDYKLPSTILTESAIASPAFNACDLLPWVASRDYTSSSARLFSEPLVQRELLANGLLADFANSFLVVASQSPLPSVHGNAVLGWRFDVTSRFCLATQTTISQSSGGIMLDRKPLGSSSFCSCIHLRNYEIFRPTGLAPLPQISGSIKKFACSLARHGFHALCIQTLVPWFQWLLDHAENDQIDGSFFDYTPFGDPKWSIKGPIPVGWVLSRSIKTLLETFSLPSTATDIYETLLKLFQIEGLSPEVRIDNVEDWLQLESEFQYQIR